jgi:hypothetical protein
MAPKFSGGQNTNDKTLVLQLIRRISLRKRTENPGTSREQKMQKRKPGNSDLVWTRTPEKEVISILEELGIGLVPYSSGQEFPSPARSRQTRHSTAPTSAAPCLVSRRRLSSPIRLWLNCSAASQKRRGDTCPNRARLAACPKSHGLFRSRATRSCIPGGEHPGGFSRTRAGRSPRRCYRRRQDTLQGTRYPERIEKMTGL